MIIDLTDEERIALKDTVKAIYDKLNIYYNGVLQNYVHPSIKPDEYQAHKTEVEKTLDLWQGILRKFNNA